jgi:hypothetical protein
VGEIYNPTSAAIDLTGWKLKDGSGSFAFPAATHVAPGKHLIVARNATGFHAWFGFAPHVAGMSLALGNSGDSLRLAMRPITRSTSSRGKPRRPAGRSRPRRAAANRRAMPMPTRTVSPTGRSHRRRCRAARRNELDHSQQTCCP